MNKEKETLHVTWKTTERSSSFAGTLFHYKNMNSGIVGSFSESLLSFYQTKFLISYSLHLD